ncbi:formyltetrahydrofolate deformylase [Lentisphaerota bacterium WC36G]|nr:formyltetrahydrofolate deformylase [Lentisphaerae bacterium WC36]
MKDNNTITFLIKAGDAKGLVSEITSFFYQRNFNILSCKQHSDTLAGKYFMRIVIDKNDLKISRKQLEDEFSQFAEKFTLEWKVNYSDQLKRVAILVSNTSHCLYHLMSKLNEGELNCEVPLIISNHPKLEYVAEQFKIPYYCLPVTKDTKPEQEQQIIDLIEKHHIDLIIMARYMQILSNNFVTRYNGKIINIHHAFLPAFEGANPYQRAYERGVKMIGATAHYATPELDKGPIIDQDVERVSHEHDPDSLKRIGKDIESIVLTRAVKAHLDDKIIVNENRTVIF